nr:MAG TPA: hypothetical protein [Caudoviricetes sp.]
MIHQKIAYSVLFLLVRMSACYRMRIQISMQIP